MFEKRSEGYKPLRIASNRIKVIEITNAVGLYINVKSNAWPRKFSTCVNESAIMKTGFYG